MQLVTSSRPQHLSLYLLSPLWLLSKDLGIPSTSAFARPLWITSDRKLNPAWLKEWECIRWCNRRSSRLVGRQVLLDAGFKRHLEDSVLSLSIAFCRRTSHHSRWWPELQPLCSVNHTSQKPPHCQGLKKARGMAHDGLTWRSLLPL